MQIILSSILSRPVQGPRTAVVLLQHQKSRCRSSFATQLPRRNFITAGPDQVTRCWISEPNGKHETNTIFRFLIPINITCFLKTAPKQQLEAHRTMLLCSKRVLTVGQERVKPGMRSCKGNSNNHHRQMGQKERYCKGTT